MDFLVVKAFLSPSLWTPSLIIWMVVEKTSFRRVPCGSGSLLMAKNKYILVAIEHDVTYKTHETMQIHLYWCSTHYQLAPQTYWFSTHDQLNNLGDISFDESATIHQLVRWNSLMTNSYMYIHQSILNPTKTWNWTVKTLIFRILCCSLLLSDCCAHSEEGNGIAVETSLFFSFFFLSNFKFLLDQGYLDGYNHSPNLPVFCLAKFPAMQLLVPHFSKSELVVIAFLA